jgi:hypothetical protein
MSKLYGSIQGDRGAATRCGHHRIKAAAQSYDGSVITELSYNDEGQLLVDVSVAKDESTAYRGTRLFYGTLDEFIAKLTA